MADNPKPPHLDNGNLIVPDEATQREVLRLYRQVERLIERRDSQSPVGNMVQPQDKDSGLVHREWVRRSRKGGEMSERTLEGERVKAAWMDEHGQIRQTAGKVVHNASGELVVESWAEGVRQERAVPRNSMVIRKDGPNRRP